MAVLEAFVYDPLLNWRLMDSAPKVRHSRQGTESSASSTSKDVEAELPPPSLPKKSVPAIFNQEPGTYLFL